MAKKKPVAKKKAATSTRRLKRSAKPPEPNPNVRPVQPPEPNPYWAVEQINALLAYWGQCAHAEAARAKKIRATRKEYGTGHVAQNALGQFRAFSPIVRGAIPKTPEGEAVAEILVAFSMCMSGYLLARINEPRDRGGRKPKPVDAHREILDRYEKAKRDGAGRNQREICEVWARHELVRLGLPTDDRAIKSKRGTFERQLRTAREATRGGGKN